MKLILFIIMAVFACSPVYAAGTCGHAGDESGETHCTGTTPWTADSASYADVNHCVNTCASEGDTVNVPAGTVSWTELDITKGIKLIGAGRDNTIITGTGTNIIHIEPANTNDVDYIIKGFTLDQNSRATSTNCIRIAHSNATPLYKLRITENTIKNASLAESRGIYSTGNLFGVIDNNIFTGNRKDADFYGRQGLSWSSPPEDEGELLFGTNKNIYFEDNIITHAGTTSSDGQGGRYVIRYNTYTITSTMTPLWDSHGNQPASYGTMMIEVYGNLVKAGSLGNYLVDHRGGRGMIFGNDWQTAASGIDAVRYRDEFGDECVNPQQTSVDYLQHINNSYYFHNRKNETTLLTNYASNNLCASAESTTAWTPGASVGYLTYRVWVNDPNKNCWAGYYPGTTTGTEEPNWAGTSCGSYLADGTQRWYNMGHAASAYAPIAENREFWQMRSTGSFNGTGVSDAGGGVGCGTLGNRPATCTTGVAYWATDQSCSDLTGLVGANATAISGTLYKCTATDTWTEYYTPYDYPHPLRGESTPDLTVTVTNTGSGHSPSHDGARTVQTGGTLTFTSGVYNGWKVAIGGTCGCTTDGCTVTPTEDCTIECTSSAIQLMPW